MAGDSSEREMMNARDFNNGELKQQNSLKTIIPMYAVYKRGLYKKAISAIFLCQLLFISVSILFVV